MLFNIHPIDFKQSIENGYSLLQIVGKQYNLYRKFGCFVDYDEEVMIGMIDLVDLMLIEDPSKRTITTIESVIEELANF